MATPNTRGAYDLLRRAMQQQGGGFCRSPNGTPEYNSDGFDSPQGGLLGRLLALQEEQNPYQPRADNSRAAPPISSDPNFRQLSRVPAVNRTQGATDSASVPEPQPGKTSAFGGVSPDSLSATTSQGSGLFGPYGGRLIPPWAVASPPMTLVPSGGRLGIPVPDDCIEQIRKARKICTDAFVDGWKSDYPVGPYKTASGKRWTIQDCMRGLISEECGGNPVDK